MTTQPALAAEDMTAEPMTSIMAQFDGFSDAPEFLVAERL